MKAALNIVIVIASLGISVCAWAQSSAQNLAVLHADTEKAFLARDLDLRGVALDRATLARAEHDRLHRCAA